MIYTGYFKKSIIPYRFISKPPIIFAVDLDLTILKISEQCAGDLLPCRTKKDADLSVLSYSLYSIQRCDSFS